MIFSKDKDGTPTSIINLTPRREVALNYFKDKLTINQSDCLRLLSDNGASVCDEPKWFDYGKDGQTKLATTKLKTSGSVVVEGALTAVLTPFMVAVDVLSFDPTLKYTRKSYQDTFSHPVQDDVELARVRKEVLYLSEQQYESSKKKAMTDTDYAVEFIKSYPGDDFSLLIDSHVNLARANKDPFGIYKILSTFPATSQQKQSAIQALRFMDTFDAYGNAFALSGDAEDAKKANAAARSKNDKRISEYMAIKLLTPKRAFDVSIVAKEQGGSSLKKDSSMTKNNIDKVSADFSCGAKIQAVKSLGLEYGDYDVVVKAMLKVPKHEMLRSRWLGNADRDYVDEHEVKQIVRLNKPKFVENTVVVFKNILTNYKDRGIAGGTTEITMVGEPRCSMEVVDVSSVK